MPSRSLLERQRASSGSIAARSKGVAARLT
jgi:hypothetical protein